MPDSVLNIGDILMSFSRLISLAVYDWAQHNLGRKEKLVTALSKHYRDVYSTCDDNAEILWYLYRW